MVGRTRRLGAECTVGMYASDRPCMPSLGTHHTSGVEIEVEVLRGKRLLNHGHTYTATKVTEYLGADRGVVPPAH